MTLKIASIVMHAEDADFVVLSDTEGNLFCVVESPG